MSISFALIFGLYRSIADRYFGSSWIVVSVKLRLSRLIRLRNVFVSKSSFASAVFGFGSSSASRSARSLVIFPRRVSTFAGSIVVPWILRS